MKPLREIVFVPALLAATTALGLLAALASDDLGDLLGAACLAAVVVVGIRPLLRWQWRRR